MSLRTVLVIVADTTGVPIGDATVTIDDVPHSHTGQTDVTGEVAIVMESIEASHIWVLAEGFQQYDHHLDLPPTNVQIRIGYPPDPARPTDVILPGLMPVAPPTPPVTSIVELHGDGVTLKNPAGERVSLCGYDQFTALRMMLDGVDLQPFIDESHALGFNLWRVFGQASATENGYYTLRPDEPGYYEALGALAEQLTQSGIYLLLVVYADNQVLRSGPEHWTRSADAVRPYASGVFLSGGNEADKNGFDPNSLPDPGMPWWSRGTWTIEKGEAQGPPTPNGATFIEYHPRRDYFKSLDDTVASANYIQYVHNYHRPLIIDEPPRMGEDGSGPEYADPFICWQFARHYSSQCAGAVFHARPGQKGVLLQPGSVTMACAEAWIAGMQV